MANVFTGGLGESSGSALASSNGPVVVSGDVWYVDSDTGVDAASPAGKNRWAPLATLGQAHTNAANGDLIVLMAGHSETLDATLTISKTVGILGGGASNGEPLAELLNDQAGANSLLTITGPYCSFHNVKFPANVQANTGNKLDVQAAAVGLDILSCRFEQGDNDNGDGVLLASGNDAAHFMDSVFVSTATTTAPESAIASAGAMNSASIINCTFDAGTIGFANPYSVDLTAGAVSALRARGNSLLRGADVRASVTGYFHTAFTTGSGRVDL